MNHRKVVSVRLDDSVHAEIVAEAERRTAKTNRFVSPSDVLREAVTEWAKGNMHGRGEVPQ